MFPSARRGHYYSVSFIWRCLEGSVQKIDELRLRQILHRRVTDLLKAHIALDTHRQPTYIPVFPRHHPAPNDLPAYLTWEAMSDETGK